MSDGPANDIQVVVVSRKFDLIRGVKENPIWDDLELKPNPEELRKVSLCIGVSPEEIKAF